MGHRKKFENENPKFMVKYRICQQKRCQIWFVLTTHPVSSKTTKAWGFYSPPRLVHIVYILGARKVTAMEIYLRDWDGWRIYSFQKLEVLSTWKCHISNKKLFRSNLILMYNFLLIVQQFINSTQQLPINNNIK